MQIGGTNRGGCSINNRCGVNTVMWVVRNMVRTQTQMEQAFRSKVIENIFHCHYIGLDRVTTYAWALGLNS